jgi:hypothetical protein
MQQVPLPARRCGAGVITGSENGTWRVNHRGEYAYSVDGCHLARPSAASALRCLKSRHLVFIGDSISRYIYLTLASFLATGSWPGDATLAAGNRSVCFEMTWHGAARALNRSDPWNVYFEGTNGALGGHELCDCYRREPRLVENRFFRLGGTSVSFLTQLVDSGRPLSGHVPPGEHHAMRAALDCSPGRCSARPRWEVSLPEAAENLLPALGATDIIFSTGHWSPSSAPPGFFERLFPALTRAARTSAAPHNRSTHPGGQPHGGHGASPRGGHASAHRGAWWRTSTPVPRYTPRGARGRLYATPGLGGGPSQPAEVLEAATQAAH